jgi:hypothetical protein
LGLPGIALGPVALSVLLHGVLLSAVAGVVLIKQTVKPQSFELAPGLELPMVLEEVQAPAEVEEEPSPEPGPDEGVPSTAMGDLDEPVVDPAIAIVSAQSSANAFLVPTSAGVKTGTAMIGLGKGLVQGKGSKGEAVVSAKEIFGMKVEAERIAVVLDCSASMVTVLKPVIDEILESFPNAIIIGTYGCEIYPGSGNPIQAYMVPLKDAQDSGASDFHKVLPYKYKSRSFWTSRGPGGALVHQAKEGSVQAIYWFADFQDPVDPTGMEEIADVLFNADVRLYVHSVQKKPDDAIDEAVKRTGGTVLIKPLK